MDLKPMIDDINILHLVPDGMFIDDAYKHFESVAPSCNSFFVPSWNRKLRYIKKTPVKFISPYSFKNPYFTKSLERYDFIVLHSLNTFNRMLLANTNRDLKFVWIGYSYDYYDFIYDDHNSLYQEKTREIVEKLPSSKIPNILKQIAKKTLYMTATEKASIIEKISFFAPVLENEYEMVASKFGSLFPDYVAWNYGTSANFCDDNEMKRCRLNDSNILVGNCATPPNNHVEVFEYLKTCNLGDKRIICPLSYGNSDYADIINTKGRAYFGEKFLGLDTFMPREKYFDLISNCSNVIMNHHRQQAAGNIVMMLSLGANVFLNKINPFYSFLSEKGAVIFTMDDLFDSPDLLDSHLSESEVERNRQVLISLYSEKAIRDKTEKLIREVISSKKR